MPEQEIPVRLVQLWLCDLCLDGAGGECHSPGCAMWINRAPDLPLRNSPFVTVIDAASGHAPVSTEVERLQQAIRSLAVWLAGLACGMRKVTGAHGDDWKRWAGCVNQAAGELCALLPENHGEGAPASVTEPGSPEVRACYCGTTATVVPGVFPHEDCDGSVAAKPDISPGPPGSDLRVTEVDGTEGAGK